MAALHHDTTDRTESRLLWWGLSGAFPAIFLSMLSNGLQGSVLGIRGRAENFPTAPLGLVMSGIYFGLLTGSLVMPRIIDRIGHRAVYVACASVFILTMPLFQFAHTTSTWFLLRVALGLSLSGIYVTNESWVSVSASPELRTTALARYMTFVYAGLIAGQLVLPLINPLGFIGLLMPALFMSFSLATNRRLHNELHPLLRKSALSLVRLFTLSPVGAWGCIGYGIAQGAYFGMGPTVSNAAGFSVYQTAGFMIAGSLGAVLAQSMTGTLARRWGRQRLTVLTALGAACTALIIGNYFESGPVLVIGVTLLWGAFSMPIYALVLAETNERAGPEDRVAISGHFLLLFGLGAIAGPAATGVFVHRYGTKAMFWTLCLVHLGIATVALASRLRRERAAIYS